MLRTLSAYLLMGLGMVSVMGSNALMAVDDIPDHTSALFIYVAGSIGGLILGFVGYNLVPPDHEWPLPLRKAASISAIVLGLCLVVFGSMFNYSLNGSLLDILEPVGIGIFIILIGCVDPLIRAATPHAP